jgi:hypothetical protein
MTVFRSFRYALLVLHSPKLECLEAGLHLRRDEHPALHRYPLYSLSVISQPVVLQTPAPGSWIPRNGSHARLCRDPNHLHGNPVAPKSWKVSSQFLESRQRLRNNGPLPSDYFVW